MSETIDSVDREIVERIRGRLRRLYSDQDADRCWDRIQALLERYRSRLPRVERRGWSERDVLLITYGDQVREQGRPPLDALREFLLSYGLDDLIRIVHLLPFFPYSSDDGFSVIDYRQVDPALGSWDDIRRLEEHFDLMFDLVLNHVSSQSRWFRAYLAGQAPYDRYFIEVDPQLDLSKVVRPRSHPLLTPVETSRGTRYVWTTFSADQVDLNYANPDVLVEIIDVLLFYIEQGARIIRLDAIAFLWKEISTSCIHLPQTHEVVKLFRDLVEMVAPHVLILTETNVPHRENISYFGNGDEAHMVYQFALPPLLLESLLSGDATILSAWLAEQKPPFPHTTFLNFTASHDGIGVRPVEGLLPEERYERLLRAVQDRGGLISTRRTSDGRDVPYELNITYVSALGQPGGMDPEAHARRFLTSQGIMLALQGMPAVYFHSLVGTTNDIKGVTESGQPRRINRRKFTRQQLDAALSEAGSLPSRIFNGYRHLLAQRVAHEAFHPDGNQEVFPGIAPWLLAVLRSSPDQAEHILMLANVSSESQEVDLSPWQQFQLQHDLITGQVVAEEQKITLPPWGLVWLTAQ